MKLAAISWAALATACLAGQAYGAEALRGTERNVLLISVDGLHQNDVDWFVKHHPSSTLAQLVNGGKSFKNARTPFPSDSFPGMVGLVTGGNPKTTGIYYDDAYSRKLLPPGTIHCSQTPGGTEVQYAENVDKNSDRLDAGQNIPGLYNNLDLISLLSSKPAKDLIDPTQLPVNPVTCRPVFPHQYLKVNTAFEVLHSLGLHTAWADKHPAYDILNGPSGSGIDDMFTPEINGSVTDPSLASGAGPDFTKDNVNTQLYDGLKVKAVLNWIQGHDHAGNGKPGVPALFGMNFQSVSTAQKLNLSSFIDPKTSTIQSNGLGGYMIDANGKAVPGPVLQSALSFVDQQLGKFVNAIDWNKTVLIVTAKHGQSPVSRDDLTIIDDGAMLDALNAAWVSKSGDTSKPLVAHAMDDDGVLLWLNDRSAAAVQFTKDFLTHYSGTGIGSDASGNKTVKSFTNAGLKKVLAGREAAEFIGVNSYDNRVPDVIGLAKQGSVFGGSKLSKIAEHGGNAADDRHVPLVIYGKDIHAGDVFEPVETTRVAPTILKIIGVAPERLQAVRLEGTRALRLSEE